MPTSGPGLLVGLPYVVWTTPDSLMTGAFQAFLLVASEFLKDCVISPPLDPRSMGMIRHLCGNAKRSAKGEDNHHFCRTGPVRKPMVSLAQER